jgi:HSP20 family protein
MAGQETKEVVPREKGSLRERLIDDPFFALQRSINEEFERFTRRFGMGAEWGPLFGPANVPAIDVTAKDPVIHVEADLPGLEPKDIDVSVVDDLLTLKGERKKEQEEKTRNTYRRESRYGAFERSIRLPARVQADRVSASFKQGVLKIDLPVLAEDSDRVKKIAVKAE